MIDLGCHFYPAEQCPHGAAECRKQKYCPRQHAMLPEAFTSNPAGLVKLFYDSETQNLRETPTRHGWHTELYRAKDVDAEIARLQRALALSEELQKAMADCISVAEGQTFEQRAEELIVTEVAHQNARAQGETPAEPLPCGHSNRSLCAADCADLAKQRRTEPNRRTEKTSRDAYHCDCGKPKMVAEKVCPSCAGTVTRSVTTKGE